MADNFPPILILSGVRGDTRRYRTFHLYEQTRLLGLDSQLSHTTDGELKKKAERSSIIVLHRASFNQQIAWLEREIHQKAGILIQDIDDLLFEPDAFKYINSIDFSDPVRATLYQEEMQLYRKTVEVCDAVTTSTNYLAERAHLLGKSVRVHRNAFSLEMLEISERAYQSRQRRDSGVVIGYASGTATHDQDFALIKPALISILSHFSNVQLWLVGPVNHGSDWGNLENRIRHLNLVPWRHLPDILTRFDINLAPLRIENPFGQSKSEIKYVEAALVRVPTIASQSDAFKMAIKQSDTSFLANSISEWESALETLIRQPELRDHMGEAAFHDVIQNYHPSVRARQLAETLSSFLGYELNISHSIFSDGNTEIGPSHSYWSCAQAEKIPSLLQMGWYTIRYRGLNILIKQIWIYIRRRVAPLFPFQKIS
jgi:glycosyltransferase involved in cell wall biosynthesis